MNVNEIIISNPKYIKNQKTLVILLRQYHTIKLLCQQNIKIILMRYQRYIKKN